MKLYLCTFRVDHTTYMGRTKKGEKDFRLVYARDEVGAQVKLQLALGTDRCEPGDDALWLRDFEAHEAIQ